MGLSIKKKLNSEIKIKVLKYCSVWRLFHHTLLRNSSGVREKKTAKKNEIFLDNLNENKKKT